MQHTKVKRSLTYSNEFWWNLEYMCVTTYVTTVCNRSGNFVGEWWQWWWLHHCAQWIRLHWASSCRSTLWLALWTPWLLGSRASLSNLILSRTLADQLSDSKNHSTSVIDHPPQMQLTDWKLIVGKIIKICASLLLQNHFHTWSLASGLDLTLASGFNFIRSNM